MSQPTLYGHPLSSYYQKAATAFYEKGIDFSLGMLDPAVPITESLGRISPVCKFPVLEDGEVVILESSAVIEYLDARYPDTVRLVPGDPMAAVEVRMMDRMFDNYVHNQMQALVSDRLRPGDQRDPLAIPQAHAMLDKLYAWLDARMAGRTWAAGDAFSLADCAAAPALLYADWAYGIPETFSNLWAYRSRLIARPSFARALDEARPFRHMFPLGAPTDRD